MMTRINPTGVVPAYKPITGVVTHTGIPYLLAAKGTDWSEDE